MTSETDVLVVGAGSAGLSAAKALRERGIHHIVVEGSHRIGGRAYSEELAPGVWFDLGCSYLHQGSTNPFGPIADGLGISLNRHRANLFSHIRFHRDGQELSVAEKARFDSFYDACDDAFAASVARGEDRAIADFVDLESEFIVPYANGMAALNTLDIDETSTADYMGFVDGDEGGRSDIPVPSGYGNLVKAWGADVEVNLNCRIERIDWRGKVMSVDTAKGTIRAKCVLLTVSNGILASGNILFDPVLPDWKTASYLGLPTGTENKIGLHFDKDVFGEDGLGFHSAWNEAGEAGGFEASVNGNNTAIVFTGGRHAIWLEKQGQEAGRQFAIDRVAEVFGNNVRKHVGRSIVTAWTSEPWTLGSYSCALPGQAHQRQALARSIDDRLFFAGEATITGANSTCHGAYLSGIRAASEIAMSLGKTD